MASWLPTSLSPMSLRSHILRTPLFTRCVLFAIVVFWVIELQSAFNVMQWGALAPSEMGLDSMYRLNTYPLIHVGFFHAFFNCLALVPLLERFESEHGTLLSLALFFGPLSTLPAGLYLAVEKLILRGNASVVGSSIWVFVLLGHEAIKQFNVNPYFSLSTYRIPTWTSPLVLLVFVSALMPSSSFLGHICGVTVGYLYGLGYLKILAPPERILRWIEGKLNLLGRLPHYVSIDQKTYGRYGVLPSAHSGPGQRLGP